MNMTQVLAVSMSSEAAWFAAVGLFIGLALLFELKFFAPGREGSLKEATIWSIGWLILALLAAVPLLIGKGSDQAVTYISVYFIERTLSLDNLFVFLLLFSYFSVSKEARGKLIIWGIVGALLMRGFAILAGVTLIERFDFVIYILAVALLALAWKMARQDDEHEVHPDSTLLVKAVRRFFPVTSGFRGKKWFVNESGKRHVTPLFLCLISIIGADIAFAIDSIPAAFGFTDDAFLIWTANGFALLGLRALFVLVEWLVARFKYMDETIAAMLAIVGIKLLLHKVIHLNEVQSLGLVAGAFTIGITLSIWAERREQRQLESQ